MFKMYWLSKIKVRIPTCKVTQLRWLRLVKDGELFIYENK